MLPPRDPSMVEHLNNTQRDVRGGLAYEPARSRQHLLGVINAAWRHLGNQVADRVKERCDQQRIQLRRPIVHDR